MHTCSMLCAHRHAYMHIYACTHAYMRVCAERRIFLTDAVCLDGNRGARSCFKLPFYSAHTIIQYKVSYSRRALIHYTVMCFEAPLSKRRQSGVWAMLACSEALSCALMHRCQGDGRVASVGVLQRRRAFFAEYGVWSSRKPASCFVGADLELAPDVCPNLRRRFRIMGTSSELGIIPTLSIM